MNIEALKIVDKIRRATEIALQSDAPVYENAGQPNILSQVERISELLELAVDIEVVATPVVMYGSGHAVAMMAHKLRVDESIVVSKETKKVLIYAWFEGPGANGSDRSECIRMAALDNDASVWANFV